MNEPYGPTDDDRFRLLILAVANTVAELGTVRDALTGLTVELAATRADLVDIAAAARGERAAPRPVPATHPVAALRLVVRARKVCAWLGVTTVGQLAALTADDLLKCRNCGLTTLADIRKKLAAVGWRLAGDYPTTTGAPP